MRGLALTAALAGAATAEGGALPACGFRCFGNMLDLAVGLGCPPLPNGNPNAACVCEKYNFGYGIRDCARESCPAEHIQPVIDYGVNWCQTAAANGVAKVGGISVTPTPAAVTALTAIPGVPLPSPSTSTWSTSISAGLVKTFTTGGKTFTTTVPTSIPAPATSVEDKHDYAASTTTTDLRGQNKDVTEGTSTTTGTTTATSTSTNTNTPKTKVNNVAEVTGTSTEVEASTTATSTATEEATAVSTGAAAPMVTGAFAGYVGAPLAIFAAGFMLL